MALLIAVIVAATVTALASAMPSERGDYAGGAVILGWVAGWSGFALKSGTSFTVQDRWLLAAVLFLWLVGRIDDRYDLRYYWKLLAQAVAAVAIVSVALPSPTTELWFSLLAVVWLVGATNAFNLSDGIDGWAPGIAMIAAGAYALTGASAAIAIAMFGAAAGFLPWNTPPARRYLGDAGSLPIGFLLGVLALYSWQNRNFSSALPWIVLTPLMMPLLDTATAITRRVWCVVRQDRTPHGLLRAVGSVVRADNDHLHHRLERSLGPRRAWLRLMLAALGFAGFGVALAFSPQGLPAFFGSLIGTAVLFVAVYLIRRVYRTSPTPEIHGR